MEDYYKKLYASGGGTWKAKSTYVDQKRNEKNTPKNLKAKAELDNNFESEGLYETDKSKKNRKETELKISNNKKNRQRMFKFSGRSESRGGTRGYDDWKDK